MDVVMDRVEMSKNGRRTEKNENILLYNTKTFDDFGEDKCVEWQRGESGSGSGTTTHDDDDDAVKLGEKNSEEKYKLKKSSSSRANQGRKMLLYVIDIDGFEMKAEKKANQERCEEGKRDGRMGRENG